MVTLSLQASHLPAESMRIVLERCYNDLRLLSVPSKTLKAEGFFRSNKVCLCLFIVSSLLVTNGVKPALCPSVCARVPYSVHSLPTSSSFVIQSGFLIQPYCCCSFYFYSVPFAWEHFFLFPCPPLVFKLWICPVLLSFCD